MLSTEVSIKKMKNITLKPNIFAVITGDIVKSSQLNIHKKKILLSSLKKLFHSINKEGKMAAPFQIYRGDSFQGVLKNPLDALQVGILLKTGLKTSFETSLKNSWDARIAIGIGEIDFLQKKGSEGDGPAFRRSGPVLDEMKGETRLLIRTPWPTVDLEFEVATAFLDVIISKWSSSQAEVISEQINGFTQQEIAQKINISQAAVNYRLKNAGWNALNKFLKRYELVINSAINNH
ncbi:SatD family protein [soil metagenome]